VSDYSLVTLNFGESYLGGAPKVAPIAQSVPQTSSGGARALPPSADRLSSLAQESTLAFSVPSEHTTSFLRGIKEVPASTEQSIDSEEVDDVQEEKRWMMKAARGPAQANGVIDWAKNSWTAFLDLLKVRNSGVVDVACED